MMAKYIKSYELKRKTAQNRTALPLEKNSFGKALGKRQGEGQALSTLPSV